MQSSWQETPLRGQSQPSRLGTVFCVQSSSCCPATQLQHKMNLWGKSKGATSSLPSKDCHHRNKTRNALLTCSVDAKPCRCRARYNRANTTSMCGVAWSSSLQLPTPSSLPWHRHTARPRHGVSLAHPPALTGHRPSPRHLSRSKLSRRGRPAPSSPFPPVPGQGILRGTAREVAEASLSVGQATPSVAQEDQTPGSTHRVLPSPEEQL